MNRPEKLPPRMLRVTRTLKSGKHWVGYYYLTPRDEAGKRKHIPLGTDLAQAKRKWAEMEHKPVDTGTMRSVFDRYMRDVLPGKAARTQKDNEREMAFLRKVFDDAPVNAVTPVHIAQYRDKRGAKAPVRANREISLLSHVFNKAREWGLRTRDNPCKGVQKLKEDPRDYYASDAVWTAVYEAACRPLRDAMDLAYLTGQRPADVLKMTWQDIEDGALLVNQNKTAKRLRILVQGRLAEVVDRIRGRSGVSLRWIVANDKGQPLNGWTLRQRFDNARLAASAAQPELAEKIKAFQFRDIRPKAASEIELQHAQALLGHSKEQITETVYRRVGATVHPTK